MAIVNSYFDITRGYAHLTTDKVEFVPSSHLLPLQGRENPPSQFDRTVPSWDGHHFHGPGVHELDSFQRYISIHSMGISGS